MDVGREIRRLRETRGWSQAKLAGETGMGVSSVSQIETGVRNPSAATLWKIAEALGVGMADLFPKGQAPLPEFEDERRLSLFIGAMLVVSGRWRKSISDSNIHTLPGIIEAALDLAEQISPGLNPESPRVAAHEYLPALDALSNLRWIVLQGLSRLEWEADPETTPAGLGVSTELIEEWHRRFEKVSEFPQSTLESDATPDLPQEAADTRAAAHD
jgi:transcriptional regulator with XRE-family HTH domain